MSFAPRPSSFMLVRERRAEGGRPRSAPRAACAAPALHPGRRTRALDGHASPHLLRARGRRSLRPALRGSTGQRGRTGVTMRPRARPGLPPLPAVRARGGRRRLRTARSRWRTRWIGSSSRTASARSNTASASSCAPCSWSDQPRLFRSGPRQYAAAGSCSPSSMPRVVHARRPSSSAAASAAM